MIQVRPIAFADGLQLNTIPRRLIVGAARARTVPPAGKMSPPATLKPQDEGVLNKWPRPRAGHPAARRPSPTLWVPQDDPLGRAG
jgi:hypothetical protein